MLETAKKEKASRKAFVIELTCLQTQSTSAQQANVLLEEQVKLMCLRYPKSLFKDSSSMSVFIYSLQC